MKKALVYSLISLMALYCLFPFAWTVITAIKPQKEVFTLPVEYLPDKISLENVLDVFRKRPFSLYIFNSLIVAGVSTFLTVFLASITAFRLRAMRLDKALSVQKFLLIGAILPPALLVIPVFFLMQKLSLVNTYVGLVIPYAALNFPFAVWLLHAGFRKIPKELDEAATLDGLSTWGILFKIIIPLSRPVLSITAILVFIFSWNEFVLALTIMTSQVNYTVPVGISMLSGASVYEVPWGEINAAVAITTLPVILLIALFQKWILEGLTSGAVKG